MTESDQYGYVDIDFSSNETVDLEAYLINHNGTDSTLVIDQDNITEAHQSVETLQFYEPGEEATLAAIATDKGDNKTRKEDSGITEGIDFAADVRKATATPFTTLPPLENAYLQVKDSNGRTDTVRTDQDGIATAENLSKGTLTYQIRDEQDPTTHGDWYDTAEQQTELTQAIRKTVPLPETTDLAPGDDYFDNNLQLLLHFQQDLLRIHPNPNDGNKDYPLKLYTKRVDTSNVAQKHIDAFKNCVKSWNWNDNTNNIYRFVDNKQEAEGYLQWGTSGVFEDTIQVVHPSNHAGRTELTCSTASHEGGQFSNLAHTNDGEAPTPAYVLNGFSKERPDTPSFEEKAQLGIGIDLRQTFPHLKNLRKLYANSGDKR